MSGVAWCWNWPAGLRSRKRQARVAPTWWPLRGRCRPPSASRRSTRRRRLAGNATGGAGGGLANSDALLEEAERLPRRAAR